jgi:hypothetical protein
VAEFRVAEERERGWQRVLRIFTLYLFAGDRAKALDWLEKAYEVRDWDMPYAFSGAETDQLQSEPRFQALRRKMNLPG